MKMKCSGFVYSFSLAIGLFFLGFNFSATAQSNDLKSEGSPISKTDEGKTNVIKTESGYQLYRNGLPYYVKGVGGDVNLDLAVQIGANSIRTWGIDNAQQILDDAQKHGMTVMLGLWLQHERHGFDYNNTEKVKIQLEHFKRVIDKFKNHPALLMWGIGNELDLQYT
ncbi:MAG: glycoside hydrolase family 2 TIM barrel-domain containing protein, partial [Bacteroidota bacterium]